MTQGSPPTECGAPVIDRKGTVLGLSIARARRHQVLALPMSLVLRLAGLSSEGK